mgnify:CR=1 FL=1
MRRRARRVWFTKGVANSGSNAWILPTRRVSTRTPSHSKPESVGKWMFVSTTVVSARSRVPSSSPWATAARTTASLRARTVSGCSRENARWNALWVGTGALKNRVKIRRVKPSAVRSRSSRRSQSFTCFNT